MNKEENLKIYEELRVVPEIAQKKFNNGSFSGTDINPMWRIKKMTEIFGMCGIGWYYDVVERSIVETDDTKSAFIAIKLYIKVNGEWSMPIYGEGGNCFKMVTKKGETRVSDEAFKMALTDAVSNATKQLGLGADIWFEPDKTKYTQNSERKITPTDIKAITAKVNACNSVEDLTLLWNNNKELQTIDEFKNAIIIRRNELKA